MVADSICHSLFSISAWGSGLPDLLPETVTVLIVFRVIGGLGIGIASMNAPMYIAEIASSNIRGKVVTYYQLAILVGFFVVFLATYAIVNDLSEAKIFNLDGVICFGPSLFPAYCF